MGTTAFGLLNEEITAEAKRVARLAGRDSGNFEDQIRAANELLRGLEIIASTKPAGAEQHEQIATLRDALGAALSSFAGSILEGERNLLSADAAKSEEAFNYLV